MYLTYILTYLTQIMTYLTQIILGFGLWDGQSVLLSHLTQTIIIMEYVETMLL